MVVGKLMHCRNMQLLSQVFLTLATLLAIVDCAKHYWDYIVVGAGPSGLQLGYYFEQAKRDYVIFERANVSGNFFTTYPRHNQLISINKRYTGKTNKEFNLRHDWNSLISHNEDLLFTKYSNKFFPPKETLVQYFNDFQKKLNINVQYSTEIQNIQRDILPDANNSQRIFTMEDKKGNTYSCKTLILATGMWKPNAVKFEGSEHTEGYETMSINPDDYEGKSVLILGRGNTAFEVADSIYGSTNLIHMISRSRVRLSWATHYVGDLRAVNNNLLDTYQLKSLDGILEAPMEDAKIIKKDGKLYVELALNSEDNESELFDNFALREAYDKVIRCLGFTFDHGIFNNNTKPLPGKGRTKKYPLINHNYEAEGIPGLFFAGTATHSLDHRKSAGGFIHGFRYTARTLSRLLEWRNHQVKWPSKAARITNLLPTILKRINEASGTYQMFGVLGDVIILKNGDTEFEYLEEVPIHLLHKMPEITGKQMRKVIVIVMEYGANFSGPGKDIFRLDRATGEPSEAFRSNFLHPVFYYYKQLPTEEDMKHRSKDQVLPTPHRIHHVVEDFLTLWTAANSHILPLRRFLDSCLNEDMRNQFAESCFHFALQYNKVPKECQEHYLEGLGLSGTKELFAAGLESISEIA